VTPRGNRFASAAACIPQPVANFSANSAAGTAAAAKRADRPCASQSEADRLRNVGPSDWQVGVLLNLGVDDRAFSKRRANNRLTGIGERLDERIELRAAQKYGLCASTFISES
jgi:hypothetical protein